MNLKVAVVDDEAPIRQWLTYCIGTIAPEDKISTAANGAEALEMMEQVQPDIVFTDICMPVMDGLELMRQAKEKLPFTKFVILTNYAEFSYAKEALSRGYRVGFTAGSDSHQMEHGVEGGIVAAFTPTHDREGIWDAMYARHTYGTTGARILVSLKIDGHMMGSELTRPVGKAVDIDISVLGTSNVMVDLLRNNQVLKTWEPGSDCLDVSLTDTGVNATDWYYVRVTQPDEHMAWSSPIWIDRA